MVSLQILNKILSTGDYGIVDNNLLTVDYFVGYESEFDFIKNHVKQYGNVPDKITFLEKYPEFELVDVTESDNYLIDKVREEYLYYKSVPVIQKAAELLKDNSNIAAEYLLNAIKTLQPNYNIGGIDIISQSSERYEQFLQRKENQEQWFFTSGFPELDDLIHGIQRGEEFFVIFARVNQGKSWVLEKICTHIWQLGFNVGYISPEMSASSIGYRFDTLYKNFSNKGLMWGQNEINETDYNEYIKQLATNQSKFIVSTPLDFDKKITVSKLKNWILQNDLNIIAVDGITYMTDERFKRGDNKTITLTNISEDLMSLSIELKIPILVVVQANRGGVVDDKAPELENIRDSDGIAHNASKVLAIKQKENGVLEMSIKKQRFGRVGGKLLYNWDIDKGEFNFIPSYGNAEPEHITRKKVENIKKSFNDDSDVF